MQGLLEHKVPHRSLGGARLIGMPTVGSYGLVEIKLE